MRIGRVVLTGAAIGTIVGTSLADLNGSHVFNAAWPPHARFHGVSGWGSVTGTQFVVLGLLWQPGQRETERPLAVTVSTLLLVAAWAPFYLAFVAPGTAVEDEPGHLARIAGVPSNMVPATLVPLIAALGYALDRRGW